MILLDIIAKNKNKINKENLKYLLETTNTKSVKEMLEYLKEIDIVEFVEIDGGINFELTEKQKEILRNMVKYDRSILLLGKSSGKTTMTSILFRYLILRELLREEFRMNRIDLVNMASSAKVARDSFYKEFLAELKKSRIFNLIDGLYKIRKNEVGFIDDAITLHSLNSQTGSFEGKNILAFVVDEASETDFKDAIKIFENGSGSVFSRFDDGKAICITWTRYPTLNKLSDNGYFLYNKYKDDDNVYTEILSVKDVRGSYPKDYNPNDPEKVKMYDCMFSINYDNTLDIKECKFIKKEPLLKLDIYEEDKYVRFKVKDLKKPKTRWCFCHIDSSISSDATVISLFYDGKYIEYHTIKPNKNYRISYEDLEELIKQLKKICIEISFDKFNSELLAQKFNCITYSFNRQEQYDALTYFKKYMDEIKILHNPLWEDRMIYEFNNITIDNNSKKWTYLGSGSSDHVDAIIYSVYNSRMYQSKMKKNKSNKTFFGLNFNLL